MRQAFKFAVRMQLIPDNPTLAVETPRFEIIERARKRPASRMGKLVYLRRLEPAGEDLPLGRGEC